MKQSRAQRDEERAIFDAFYKLRPDFAGEPIKGWRLADADPPDIICVTATGRRIGVELGEWLHQGEMSSGKLRERSGQQLLEAIGEPQPVNTSRHFEMVILYPRDRVRIEAGPNQVAFREALLKPIADVDRRWPQEPSWHGRQGCRIRDLTPWPPLGKHLKEVHFHPGQSKWDEGVEWITLPLHCDTFDDRTMYEALLQLLLKKTKKYQLRGVASGCDGLVLLVYFSQGVAYNPPITIPRRSIEDLVYEAQAAVAHEHGPFSMAYLFLAIIPGSRVFRIW